MLSIDSVTAVTTGTTGTTDPEAIDLPAAMAEAAQTADAYHVNANRAEAGFKGAPDPTWLRSQSAICLARQRKCTDRAQREQEHRDTAKWQCLALGYAEAARILGAAGTEEAGHMVAALLAAAALLKAAPSRFLRPWASSAAPAYVDMAALSAAHLEARECRTARTLHQLESEMLLLACYARDHNPPMLEAVTQALAALTAARDAGLDADPVTEALDAVAAVLCHAVLDPILTAD